MRWVNLGLRIVAIITLTYTAAVCGSVLRKLDTGTLRVQCEVVK